MTKAALILTIPVTVLLAACGSTEPPPVSKGEQLTDLQGAYQSRAITDDEYEDEKEKILDQ